jgi:hypothetical protein
VQLAGAVETPLLQEPARHSVPGPGYVQETVLFPSQAPPQAVPSLVQSLREPWGSPVTGAQVPSEPGTSQASHWPSQAELQQRPSTQFPLVH